MADLERKGLELKAEVSELEQRVLREKAAVAGSQNHLQACRASLQQAQARETEADGPPNETQRAALQKCSDEVALAEKALGGSKKRLAGVESALEVALLRLNTHELHAKIARMPEGPERQALLERVSKLDQTVDRMVQLLENSEAKAEAAQSRLDELEAALDENHARRWRGRPSRSPRSTEMLQVTSPVEEEAPDL